jgi:CHAT domain-containing protein
MSNFYRLHQDKSKPSIAASLRDAQLRMIDNKIAGKDFRQPFYWAPFVLMGDWR